MAATPSTMLPLGTPAPDFALLDTDGQLVSLEDQRGAQALVVMFICNHCPYVKHIAPQLAQLARDYKDKPVRFVAINSNDADTYPADNPLRMAEEKAARGYTFPYLFDATQEVAQAFTAACTPDLFVFDAALTLAYRGQLDPTRPTRLGPGQYDHSNAPDGSDLRAALDALLNGQRPNERQVPSIGCNIKWKPGNEPTYS